MKYTVQVTGEAALGLEEQDFELEAADANAASEAARARLTGLLPKTGGLLNVTISATEPWTITAKESDGTVVTRTRPPGVVTSWGFMIEPHESVRPLVEARRNDAALAKLEGTERAKERARLVLGLSSGGAINQEQLLSALSDSERSLESIVEQALAEKAVSK